MQPEYDLIISDASCLILLDKIEEIGLLKLLSNNVCVTNEVANEFKKSLPSWIKIKEVRDVHYQRILENELGAGESSSIAYALECENAILVIDELKGRKVAERLSLRYSGTFGLMLKAKKMGLIQELKPIIIKVKLTNFRISKKIIETVLKEAGEF